MAWSLPCRLCSGCCDFRKDKNLKAVYSEIKESEKKIDALVNFSPCVAMKILIAYKDNSIARAFVARYESDAGRLHACDRRRDLIEEYGESRGIERLPYLASLAAMVECSLVERASRPASVICGLNFMDEIFGTEDQGYVDAQQQAWARFTQLMEEPSYEGLTLKERGTPTWLHRYAGS